MPWVLIGRQIQLLNENMNQRFHDERLRMDERFAVQERQITERVTAPERRRDERFAAVDHRLDTLDHRFEFRISSSIPIVLAALTLIIGALLEPSLGI